MGKHRLRTTAKHFALFKREASECLEKWGINDLHIYFHHGKRNARATFSGDNVKRVATITLSLDWEKWEPDDVRPSITDEDIRVVARHECVHALLLPIAALPGSFCTEAETEMAEEAVVQRLLRILP
jgi:hypothetical protein